MRAPLFSRRTSKCRFAVWRFILEPFANQAPWQIQIQWNTAQLKGSCWWIFAWHECDCVYFFPTAIDSRRWTGQRVRCFMLVSVDVPLYGLLEVALTASSTAGDIIYLLRERLPDCPWHGTSCFQVGFANYSAMTLWRQPITAIWSSQTTLRSATRRHGFCIPRPKINGPLWAFAFAEYSNI